ncbi:MAG: hypothetical protein O2999_12470 [Nitrospirae bacterium]|nr:hypothetical protein [Nitrospirota bacterium]
MGILNSNFVGIIGIANPERKKPLNDDERNELTLHLNSFYFHIRGALDNLAWCLAYEFKILGDVEEEARAFQAKVSLFGTAFQRRLEEGKVPFLGLLKELSAWSIDMKTFRDPIAHRIPLYAIPSVLSQEEATQYQETFNRAMRVLAEGKLEEVEVLLNNAEALGSYVPSFSGSFASTTSPRPIYPQVTEDYANVIKIGDAVIDFLGQPYSVI